MQFDFVVIPATTIRVGLSVEDAKAEWAKHEDLQLPWHYFAKETGEEVHTLNAFALQRAPMTWNEAIELSPTLESRCPSPEQLDCPVDGLSYLEAELLAASAAQRCDRPTRLPTEVEWEWAARGPEDRAYPWGDTFDPQLCNTAEAGRGGPVPSSTFVNTPNQFGLLDLAGNVDEWTSTIYAPYRGGHWTVPVREAWAVDPHVTRGGSWRQNRDLSRTRRRHGHYRPETGAGLRLVHALGT